MKIFFKILWKLFWYSKFPFYICTRNFNIKSLSINLATMKTKWAVDAKHSDVLIKIQDATITYLGGEKNYFDGFVAMDEDQIEDASVEFTLDNTTFPSALKEMKNSGFKKPMIRFKSTSFQKFKNNINFFKGNLTIKDITKMVELDAEFIGINECDGSRKAAFEIKGDINRRDFGLDKNFNFSNNQLGFGKNLKLVANLEFSI